MDQMGWWVRPFKEVVRKVLSEVNKHREGEVQEGGMVPCGKNRTGSSGSC